PNPLFFLRSNNPPPSVSASDWRLRIDGRVRKPVTVSLAELRELDSQREEVWLECAGNSRRRYAPAAEGNQWDEQAVSNASLTGVALRDLLDRVEIKDEAVEVVATGADVDAKGTPFQRGLPIDVARQSEVMLAWEMNGEPIPPPNGGPVRLVV